MTAAVLGANGQDGTFLVRHLLKQGFAVRGVGAQERSRHEIPSPRYTYQSLDLRKTEDLTAWLKAVKPDRVFHVAAVHLSAGGRYESLWPEALQVNVASVQAVLEYLRLEHPESRLVYASSGKVFGEPYPAVVHEEIPHRGNGLYEMTKKVAGEAIEYYRRRHGVKALAVYLFNHESLWRPAHFFIPKVVRCLAEALKNPRHTSSVQTLDFYCDWGSAEEYTDLMVEVAEASPWEDVVMATGTATQAEELVATLFARHGLEYRNHLQAEGGKGVLTQPPYRVQLDRLKDRVGRVPTNTILEVCERMLESYSADVAN